MKTLPRAVATGEVSCGRSRDKTWDEDMEPSEWPVSEQCTLPANHEGACNQETVDAFIPEKHRYADKGSTIHETGFWGVHGNPRKDDWFKNLYTSRGSRSANWGTHSSDHIAYSMSMDGNGNCEIQDPDTKEMVSVPPEVFWRLYNEAYQGKPPGEQARAYERIAREELKRARR